MNEELLRENEQFLRRLVRGLARDEHTARDLEQATWVAALEHPPRSVASFRAWLARVARNLHRNLLRAEASETARRASADPRLPSPPTDSVTSELELARRVLEAVQSLPEDLRLVVHAHYYEERSLGDIARHAQLSRETVKDRLERARERLRRRLGREFDEPDARRGWLALLVRGLRIFLGGVVMKGAVVLLALVVALFLYLNSRERGSGDRQPTEPAPVVVESVQKSAPELEAARGAEREALASPAEQVENRAGALRVHVLWADGSAASDVGLRLWNALDGGERRYRLAHTDSAGEARFEPLAAGTWRVQLDRETDTSEVEVQAGEEASLRMQVSLGSRVEGLVVDERGQPVAGAGVWISTSAHSDDAIDDSFAARTGADGRFTIPSLGRAWLIGARADGHAPSPKKALRWRRPLETVRLVLHGAGGTIEGSVHDEQGRPVAGVIVSGDLGHRFLRSESETGQVGILNFNHLIVRTLTSDSGAFRFEGVQPSSVELTFTSVDHGQATRRADVQAGETTRLEVELTSGRVLRGLVRTPQGEPVAGAVLVTSLSSFPEPVDPRAEWLAQNWPTLLLALGEGGTSTRSSRTGEFELRGLQPGWSFVVAQLGDLPQLVLPVRVSEHDESRLEIVMERGLELACRLVGRDGAALPALDVWLEEGEGPGPFRPDAEGRLRIPDCREASYSLVLRQAGTDIEIVHNGRGLRPGGEQLVTVEFFERAGARVRGTVLDSAGEPLSGADVELAFESGGSKRVAVTDEHGRFLSSRFDAGEYGLWVRAADHPPLELPVAAYSLGTRDLGPLRLEAPGFLTVRLRAQDGQAIDSERWHVDLFHPDGSYLYVRSEIELGEARFDPLPPGVYRLRANGVDEPDLLRIEAGATLELEITR